MMVQQLQEDIDREKSRQHRRTYIKSKIINGYVRDYNIHLDIVRIINVYLSFEIEKIKCRILFLGAGQVGKATIFKQLRMLNGRKFDDKELKALKPILQQNVIEAMRTLAICSDILADNGKDTSVCAANKEIRDRVVRMSDRGKFTQQHYEDFNALWSDPGIQQTKLYRNMFPLVDTFEYLFENMHKYCQDEYIPTFYDHTISRIRTLGVTNCEFIYNNPGNDCCYKEYIYDIYNIGGQRTESLRNLYKPIIFECMGGISYESRQVLNHIIDVKARRKGLDKDEQKCLIYRNIIGHLQRENATSILEHYAQHFYFNS